MVREPFDPPYSQEDLEELDRRHEAVGLGEYWLNSDQRCLIERTVRGEVIRRRKMLEKEGFLFFTPDDELVEMRILDTSTNDFESIYQPNEKDVKQICEKYELNYNKLINIIRNKDKYTHTLLIDVQIYKQREND